jgi:bifunctional non-homologous end joining protein LigD
VASSTVVRVGERELSLSNLDKVLYPNTGTTKGEAINYYARIAPVMVPHLGRPVHHAETLPERSGVVGVLREAVSETSTIVDSHRARTWRPRGRHRLLPIRRAGVVGLGREHAALELHVPMAAAADLETPLAVVFDFDPGAPAAIKECCEVALWVREVLAAVDMEGWCKTSGSKGLQMYVPLNTPATHDGASDFALAVGQVLERQNRDRVTTIMAKVERPGRSSSTGARTPASRRPSVCTRCEPGPSPPCRRR